MTTAEGGDPSLPEGWSSVPIGEACNLNPGKPSIDALPRDSLVTFVPMPAVDEDLGAITNPQDRQYASVRQGFTAFQDEDVIFAKITPCMENGKAAIARRLTNGLGFGSTEFHVLRPNGVALPEYLYHFVRQQSFRDAAAGEMTGSVGQKRVPTDYLRRFLLPLAPLDEQRRIVAMAELLARNQACRDRLSRVPTILKKLRQAILAAACSGRLTEEWRYTHESDTLIQETTESYPFALDKPESRKRQGRLWGGGEVPELTDEDRVSIPESWQWKKVKEIGVDSDSAVQIGPMSMKSSEFTESGIPVLNVGCVQPGWIDTSKCDYLPEPIASRFERYRVKENDVLFTRSGTVGRCAVVPPEQSGNVITFHLLRVRPDQRQCLSRYLWIVFQGATTIRKQTEEGQIGSTRAGFNTRLLESLDVPLPPVKEQVEIVRRVDALFKVADAIDHRLAAASSRADSLTQAILGKAFRGELVPTEAEVARRDGRDYESASMLLERVKAGVFTIKAQANWKGNGYESTIT